MPVKNESLRFLLDLEGRTLTREAIISARYPDGFYIGPIPRNFGARPVIAGYNVSRPSLLLSHQRIEPKFVQGIMVAVIKPSLQPGEILGYVVQSQLDPIYHGNGGKPISLSFTWGVRIPTKFLEVKIANDTQMALFGYLITPVSTQTHRLIEPTGDISRPVFTIGPESYQSSQSIPIGSVLYIQAVQ